LQAAQSPQIDPAAAPARDTDAAAWIVAGLGLALLFGPTYWSAAQGIWQTDDMGHGPIVLAVSAWLFWSIRHPLRDSPFETPTWVAWALLVLGLAMHMIGRLFAVSSVEFAAQLPVVAALLLLLRGSAAVRTAWFALVFLLFTVPLPGSLVDAITGPLKQWISVIVVELMHAVGYPIGRAGVVITVGQYQLLVADACSGLNSIFSLSALGTLFMYIMRRPGHTHNALMLLSIVPIAFLANIVRVISLVLVTYHWGDEAGQGFLHGAAGIVLMLAALVLFFCLDALMCALRRNA
jgi:exosortase B